jgi:hypothetical protein
MSDSKIILLDEIIEHKKKKEQELRFYLEKKDELERKLFWIKKEIDLTNTILKMIEKEAIEEIKK